MELFIKYDWQKLKILNLSTFFITIKGDCKINDKSF